MAIGKLGLAPFASAQPATFLDQLPPAGGEDRPFYAPATLQAGTGGIHDGIHGQPRDVRLDERYAANAG